MRLKIVVALSFFSLLAASIAAPSPIPSKADYPLIDSLNYKNEKALRESWKPMSDTTPVSMVIMKSGKALEMSCDYEKRKCDRSSWDLSVDLDLTVCNGIQFKIFCDDPTPISGFTFYMRNGRGWYSREFSVNRVGKWNTVIIEKSKTGVEGTPAGWSRISTLRVSAWRGKCVNTKFYLADIGLYGADASIALVRAESIAGKNPKESESVITYTGNVAQSLKELGISYAMVGDLDLTAERLKNIQVVILPHNPNMPKRVIQELIKYLHAGGKLIAFYILPGELRHVVNIHGVKHVRQSYAGNFSSMRFNPKILVDVPLVVKQRSWNISEVLPIEGKSAVAALWYNDKGENTGRAAVVVSDNCIFMTHVLLTDDLSNKRDMLLAMLGRFMPKLWKKTTHGRIDAIGRFAAYKSFRDAVVGIKRLSSGDLETRKKVKRAEALRSRSAELCSSGKYADAIRVADKARAAIIDAYCSAQKPSKRREHRAWWCHSAFGVPGMNWDKAIKMLKDSGFTAILPNMLWAGTAYYNSDILPVDKTVKEKGDQIKLCMNACRKYGVECHVWKVNWNMGSRATKEFINKMVAAGRTQVLYDGTRRNNWLCPSHPANQKLEINSMIEVGTKYDVDGIHFDYIRYPGSHSCFCDGCRAQFEKRIGFKVKNWPKGCRKNEAVKQKWLEFRRSNITKVVAAVSSRVRKIKPTIKISAAVFRNWPVDRNNLGQDWKLWCEKEYLDFVCPMDYMSNCDQFKNIVMRQQLWAGKVPCYPGIGLGCWKPSNDICKLIEQIKITRKLRTGGFTIFNYSEPEFKKILPLCGKGITHD